MAIGDLDVEGIFALPSEADAPLIVDANAELPLAVALECLQPIARWHTKVVQSSRMVNS